MRAIHSIEDQWLSEIHEKLNVELKELIKGSKESGWPDSLEEAVSHLQDAMDSISSRRGELDEMETGEAA